MMKKTLTALALMLLAAPFAQGAPAKAKISLTPKGTDDRTAEFLAAVERVRKAGSGEIRLAPGFYHFRSPKSMSFYVSNHDNRLPRRVFLPILGVTNLAVTCKGGKAEFIFHGDGLGIELQDTKNVTLRGIGVDWARPDFSEGRFVRFDEGGKAVISFDPTQFPMRIDGGGHIVSVCEGKEMGQYILHAFDGKDRGYKGDAWFSCRVTDLGGGLYRFEEDWSRRFGRGGLQAGDIFVMRNAQRDNPAVNLYRAKNTKLEDCVIRSSSGMGFIAQRSENVVVRGTKKAEDATAGAFARPDSGRVMSLQADATHFSNCRGKIVVENCLFEGMVDDAINVHSTCLQIESMKSPTEIRCRYKHGQSTGFEVFLPGEHLRGIHARTLEPTEETVVVKSATMVAHNLVDLTLAAPVPEDLKVGDAVENADWQPSVLFRNNIVRYCSPRATLFTTPGRVICEGNLFDHINAQAVHLSADAWDWYESGACSDIVIRNNIFRECMLASGRGVIQIDPNVKDLNAQRRRYHRNVRVEDNVFEQTRGPLLFARSVSNLVWKANQVRGKANGFDVQYCDDVKGVPGK